MSNHIITVFSSVYDRETNKRIERDSFDEIEKFFLDSFRDQPFANKEDASLFSPAVYRPNTTRKNVNVEKFSQWFAADLDSFKLDTKTELSLQNQLESAFPKSLGRYRYFVYSTARSSFDRPKMRVIFQLTDEVKPDKISIFWHAVNEILGGSIDKQTKDHARMFYQPGQYSGSDNRFFFSSAVGRPAIDPAKLINSFDNQFLITQSFAKSLPDSIISDMQRQKREKLDKSYTWNSWQDCPFVNKDRVSEYHAIVVMNSAGRYLGLYRLMASIASIAVKKGYPISANEVEQITQEIDNSIDGFYKKRNISKEAAHAVSFAYESA